MTVILFVHAQFELFHLQFGKFLILLIKDVLERASIALIVPLDEGTDSIVYYTWILLSEAGGYNLRGLMVLVHQIRSHNCEQLCYMLHMLQN